MGPFGAPSRQKLFAVYANFVQRACSFLRVYAVFLVCMQFCVLCVCIFVSFMNAHFLGKCMQFCRVLYAVSVGICAISFCVCMQLMCLQFFFFLDVFKNMAYLEY